MRVLILDAPQAMLDERRRLGLDGRDEVWDGVVHVVPPAGNAHQSLSLAFYDVVGSRARARGLLPLLEAGLFESTENFRVPDQLYYRPDQRSERGAEGAELVVEVRSPRDETYDKLAFYAERGVREVLVLHPEPRAVELFVNVGGAMQPAPADASGAVHCAVLDLSIAAVDAVLRITWPGHSADI